MLKDEYPTYIPPPVEAKPKKPFVQMCIRDMVSGDLIIEVEFENHPAKGRLTIHKEGEVVKGFVKDFTYEDASLAGAVFEVDAAEDIYTADH